MISKKRIVINDSEGFMFPSEIEVKNSATGKKMSDAEVKKLREKIVKGLNKK